MPFEVVEAGVETSRRVHVDRVQPSRTSEMVLDLHALPGEVAIWPTREALRNQPRHLRNTVHKKTIVRQF